MVSASQKSHSRKGDDSFKKIILYIILMRGLFVDIYSYDALNQSTDVQGKQRSTSMIVKIEDINVVPELRIKQSVRINSNSQAVHSNLAGNPHKQVRAFVLCQPIYLYAMYTLRSK